MDASRAERLGRVGEIVSTFLVGVHHCVKDCDRKWVALIEASLNWNGFHPTSWDREVTDHIS